MAKIEVCYKCGKIPKLHLNKGVEFIGLVQALCRSVKCANKFIGYGTTGGEALDVWNNEMLKKQKQKKKKVKK